MNSDAVVKIEPDIGILRGEFSELNGLEETTDELHRVLKRIIARHPIREVLKEIVSDSRKIRGMVGFAYGHRNGFDKFIMDSLGQFRPRLRLHIWWEPSDSGESTVHNHPWNFASFLVAGKLVMRRYQQSDGKEPAFVRLRFPTKALPEIQDAIVEGAGSISCMDVQSFERGESYSLRCSELHSVTGGNGPLVTLVLQGKHVADSSIVYAKSSDPEQTPTVSRYFSEDEILRKLTKLLSIILWD